MTDSIKEQLLKMGLVTAEQTRQVKTEQRQSRTRSGRKRGGTERAARQPERDADRKAGDHQRERGRHAEAPAADEVRLVGQIVDSGRLTGKIEGRNRFYFETRDGRVPYVEVDQGMLGRLASGQVAVCESPAGAVSLVDGDAAARIAELDRRWLRAWNG